MRCGADTVLRINGVPICVECDKADETSAAASLKTTESDNQPEHPSKTGGRLFDGGVKKDR